METNGLLPDVSKIHVIVTYDPDTCQFTRFDKEKVKEGLKLLSQADVLVGHNIIGYDLPVIQHIHPSFTYKARVLDTMVWGRLAWPEIKNTDFGLHKKGVLPGKLIGSHSLEAYGYRMGDLKGDFKKTTDWKEWSPAMSDYCEGDVRITAKLYDKLLAKQIDQRAIELEHEVAKIITRQMHHGLAFDVQKAEALYATLIARRAELAEQLKASFPPWYVSKGEFTPKRSNKTVGYVAGATCTKVEYTELNPSSRPHLVYWLKRKYGWQPKEFTNDGSPKLDEDVMRGLPYPESDLLVEYFTLDKRIGQLAEGDQAWMKAYNEKTHRIHGYVNTNGAVTGRMTHSKPNMAQVPRVGSPYGRECRDLFTVPPGYKMVGVDASGLELRCLAHFMSRYDNGDYAKVVEEGDVHTANQHAAGLKTRDQAKTFIYAFLYGAGDEKIGNVVGKGSTTGRALKRKFLATLPALDALKTGVESVAERKKYIIGLDGRVLPIRSTHAALNTLLQSAGALIMKKALVILDNKLRQEFTPGKDYEFVLNVHDEFQIEAREEIADRVGQLAVEGIQLAGESFGFRCALSGQYRTGSTWAETH